MDSLWRFYSFGKCEYCVAGWPIFPDPQYHYNPYVSWCQSHRCVNVQSSESR